MTATVQGPQENEQEPKPTSGWTVALVTGLIFIVALLPGLLPLLATSPHGGVTWTAIISKKWTFPDTTNAFGDTFGFANAIISGFAFAALVITMFWQRQELRLQWWEIKKMREANQEIEKSQKRSAQSLLAAATISALESIRESTEKSLENQMTSQSYVLEQLIFRNSIEFRIMSTVQSDIPNNPFAKEIDQQAEKMAIRLTSLLKQLENLQSGGLAETEWSLALGIVEKFKRTTPLDDTSQEILRNCLDGYPEYGDGQTNSNRALTVLTSKLNFCIFQLINSYRVHRIDFGLNE